MRFPTPRRTAPLLLILAASVCFHPLHATTLLRLSLTQLANAADAVARVRCIENSAYAEQGNVWTRTQFQVIEPLKGSLPHQVAVRLPGGHFGRVTVSIDAVPRFRAGEEGVLFLQTLPDGEYSIVGWAVGSFRIHRNERTGEESITQDSSAIAVADPISRRFVTEGMHNVPLAEFRRRLRATLGENGTQGSKAR